MVIRYTWYLFESRSSTRVHSTYAPIGMMHMMNRLLLDKVTFDILKMKYSYAPSYDNLRPK